MKIEVLCLGQSYIFNERSTDYKICSVFWNDVLGLFRIFPLTAQKSNLFGSDCFYIFDVDKHRTDKRSESFHLVENLGKSRSICDLDLLDVLESCSKEIESLLCSDSSLGVSQLEFSVVRIGTHSRVLSSGLNLSYSSTQPTKPGKYKGFAILSRKYDWSEWLIVNHFSEFDKLPNF